MTFDANYQKHYNILCNEHRMKFAKSENEAETEFNSTQNKTVLWLKVIEGDQDYFTLHRSRGPLHRLYTQYDNCDPLILIKNSDAVFIISGSADKQKVEQMLEACAVNKHRCFEDNCKNGNIEFIAENSNISCNSQCMHWLRIEENDVIWLHSNGSFAWLRDNAKVEYKTLDEEQFSHLAEGKFAIIADDPGMGKSTTLTSLSGKLLDTNWVIRIDFRECIKAIKTLPPNTEHLDMEIVRDFFCCVNSTGFQSDLAKQLFLHKLQTTESNHRNILILFDAFDEINNEQQQKVVILLKFLKDQSSAKVWITTRRSKVRELENSLFTFATELTKFDECQQEEFLYKCWRIRLNMFQKQKFDNNLRNYASNLLKRSIKYLGDKMNLFMGVPLQLRLLAEGFHDDALKYSHTESKSDPNLEGLNILSMYKRFINEKYGIYFREKSLLSCHSQYIIKSISNSFKKHHKCIAFNMMFPDEMDLICDKKLPSKEYESDLQSVGIIQSFGKDDKMYFIHRTFAEYFVAIFLNKNLKKRTEKFQTTIQFLQRLLFSEDNLVIRRFLDQMLVKILPMHIAALEGDTVKFCENDDDDVEVDRLGRTPLHLAAQEGHLNVVKVLLDNGCDHCKCDIFGKTPLHYATMNGHLDAVKHLIYYTADIDARSHVLRLAFQVNEEFGCNITPAETEYLSSNIAKFVNQFDKTDQSSLHYAAANQYWDIACILIANGADVRGLSKENQKNILEFALQYNPTSRFSEIDETLPVIGLLLKFPHNFNAKGVTDPCSGNSGQNFLARRNLRLEHLKTSLYKHRSTLEAQHLLTCLDVLSADTSNVEFVCDKEHTLLARAIKNEAVCDSNGFALDDVNATDDDGKTRLHHAAENYDLLEVKRLVETGADVNITDDWGMTALDCALSYSIISDSLDINEIMNTVRYLLIEYESDSGLTNHDIIHANTILKNSRQTSLHNAVTLSTPLFALYLIKAGADVNGKDKKGRTPLHYAALDSLNCTAPQIRLHMVLLLLRNGAIYDSEDNEGKSVLEYYMQYPVKSEVFYLLQDIDSLFHDVSKASTFTYRSPYDSESAFCKARNKNKNTLLHLAAAENAAQVFQIAPYKYNLNDPLINARNNQGNTPLHLAAANGNIEVVKLLLQREPIVKSKNYQGDTPLEIAIKNDHNDIVEILQAVDIFTAIETISSIEFEEIIRKEQCLGIRDQDNKSLFHWVTYYGRVDLANLISCKFNFPTEWCDFNKYTPLHYAAKSGQAEMVKFLLRHGAQYNAMNKFGQTPLTLAKKQPILDLLKSVHRVYKHMRTNKTNKVIKSLKAIQNSNSSDFSAVRKSTDNTGNTLLHISARQNNFEISKLLLQFGAVYNASNCNGKRPDDITNDQGIKELFHLIHMLFLWSPNFIYTLNNTKICPEDFPNSCNYEGKTILHYAGPYTRKTFNYCRMKKLIQNGADINATDNTGKCVLDDAIEYNNLDLVKLLLLYRVDISKLAEGNLEKLKHNSTKEGRHDIVLMLNSMTNEKTASIN